MTQIPSKSAATPAGLATPQTPGSTDTRLLLRRMRNVMAGPGGPELRLDQIVRLESDGSYTTFYLLNQERHVVSRPMKEFEELLPEDEFFKLHQSHLVNLAFIKKILREEGGFALMEDGCKVPIARRRKEEFLEVMRQRFRC